jgi:lysophospholipase L1-like esterase
MPPLIRAGALLVALTASISGASRAAADQKFSFGPGPAAPGWVRVAPGALYTQAQGYGFEPGSDATVVDRGGDDPERRLVLTGSHPFFFSVAEPEGNYTVTVLFGDPQGGSTTTVKSELRRLEVEELHTEPGRFATRTFTVNLRTPAFVPDGLVHLKPRERTGEAWDWDEKLTLEFNGEHPCVCSVTVAPAPLVPTVYLAGDSTVCDQPYEPFNSWGQMLPRFFGPGVAIANHAESGESLRSFIAEKRLAKLDTLMRTGDYLFIQFGHNDMKEHGEGVGAFTTYKADLERFVADARAHGATPVLVTSVSRRTFGPDGMIQNSFGDYIDAVRRVAKEQGVALIDLNAKSVALYEALGPEGAKALFPIVRGTIEGTHHDNYGSYEMAKCVVEGIKEDKLPLAGYLIGDTQPFNPSHPDPLGEFDVPPSPKATTEVPYGK